MLHMGDKSRKLVVFISLYYTKSTKCESHHANGTSISTYMYLVINW